MSELKGGSRTVAPFLGKVIVLIKPMLPLRLPHFSSQEFQSAINGEVKETKGFC